nr:hypothetical protein [Tanacetum cinerariifolium]
MMSFLSAVVISCYPTTNNQLRNSSNSRKQATINDGKVTLQPVQGRQISFATGTTRTYTSRISGSNSGKQRTVIYYNCKGEGHMSKQYTKPKRKHDDSWFRDKVLLNAETGRLKQTVFEQLQEKESLMKTVTVLKNDFKKEESRNIDREIALEKKIKHLDNIVYERDQSAQTVLMLTKPKFFYDHTTKQALETLMYAEESGSKMILKQQDPMVLEKKVNTTTVDYAILNQLSQDFEKQFVPQTELYAEQAFCSQNSMYSLDPNLSKRPPIVEVPKELPKVGMAVEQHRLESKTFEVKMNQVLNENERLLEQVINKDTMNIVMNSSVDNASVTLRDELRKLKGKAIVDNTVTTHTIDSEMLKVNVEPIAPRLLNNMTVHSDYLRLTQEQAVILKEVVKQGKSLNPLNNSLDHA